VRFVGAVLTAAAMVLLLHPARAQSNATDNELYAAYCKGFLDSMLAPPIPPGTDPNGYLAQQRAKMQQNDQRFTAYLLSTGALTDAQRTDASLGVVMAMNRGKADLAQCMQEGNSCHLDLADPKSGAQYNACVERLPACARVRRCHESDHLPF